MQSAHSNFQSLKIFQFLLRFPPEKMPFIDRDTCANISSSSNRIQYAEVIVIIHVLYCAKHLRRLVDPK